LNYQASKTKLFPEEEILIVGAPELDYHLTTDQGIVSD
jgi:hypothetical protein